MLLELPAITNLFIVHCCDRNDKRDEVPASSDIRLVPQSQTRLR